MQAPGRVRGVVAQLRWSILLGLLLVLYFFDALTPRTLPVELVSQALHSALFAGTLLAARLPAVTTRLGLTLVLVLWPLFKLLSFGADPRVFDALHLATVSVILVGSLVVTFRELSRNPRPGRDEIFGAIFGYFLIALAFAMFYIRLETVQPGSFDLPASEGLEPSLIYFSLVTFTTLGYGDITPFSRLARVVAGLQAASGTMYVAVFIATLLSRRRGES